MPGPPRGASEEEKRSNEAKFNHRARCSSPDMQVPTATGYAVEVPVLLGPVAKPLIPEDDAAVPDGSVREDRAGMLLLGAPDGKANAAAVVPEHDIRDDGMAGQHGPATAHRVG